MIVVKRTVATKPNGWPSQPTTTLEDKETGVEIKGVRAIKIDVDAYGNDILQITMVDNFELDMEFLTCEGKVKQTQIFPVKDLG